MAPREQLTPHQHVVQLYRDPGFMRRVVADWVLPPLQADGGAILVCTPEHAEDLRAELRRNGLDPAAFEQSGRLAFVNAEGLMSRFLVDGMPDPEAFLRLASALVRSVRSACGSPQAEVRAWGEMVNILFHRGDSAAAQALEHLWNEAIARERIHLLCSYRVDNLHPATHDGLLHDICRGHTRLLPEENEASFERAISRAMEEVLGPQAAREAWRRYATRPPLSVQMPPAEAVLVGLHASNPEAGRTVLARAREHLAAAN